MLRGAECLLRWRIRAVISRRVAAAACANNDKSRLDREPAQPPRRATPRLRSRHNADVLLDRRCPMRVRRVLCSLFYNPLPYCPSNTDKGNIWEADAIFV
uniref:Uncharacterized protein n=1 Tax=Heliothis virescens TaxID=7102 RepID=A0A2A4JE00_HELVI